MALMILVALVLHPLLRPQAPTFSLTAVAIDILDMLLTGIVHALLMAGTPTQGQFNITGEVLGPSEIAIGLLLANYLALRGKALPRGLIWAGLIAEAGYLMSGVGGFDRRTGNSKQWAAKSAIVGWPTKFLLCLPDLGHLVGRWMLVKPHGEPQRARSG
jgi:hypothetical protein